MKATVKTSQLPELLVTCTFDLDSIHNIEYMTGNSSRKILEIGEVHGRKHTVTKKLQDIATHVSVELVGRHYLNEQALVLRIPQVELNAEDLVGLNEAVCAVPAVAKMRKSLKSPWTKIRPLSARDSSNKDMAVLRVFDFSQHYWNLELCQASTAMFKEWFYENWTELYEATFKEIGMLYRLSKECETDFQANCAAHRMDDIGIGCTFLASRWAEQKLNAMTADMFLPQHMEIEEVAMYSLNQTDLPDFMKSVQE